MIGAACSAFYLALVPTAKTVVSAVNLFPMTVRFMIVFFACFVLQSFYSNTETRARIPPNFWGQIATSNSGAFPSGPSTVSGVKGQYRRLSQAGIALRLPEVALQLRAFRPSGIFPRSTQQIVLSMQWRHFFFLPVQRRKPSDMMF